MRFQLVKGSTEFAKCGGLGFPQFGNILQRLAAKDQIIHYPPFPSVTGSHRVSRRMTFGTQMYENSSLFKVSQIQEGSLRVS